MVLMLERAEMAVPISLIMSTPPGDGCVGASILPREVVGTHSKEVTHG